MDTVKAYTVIVFGAVLSSMAYASSSFEEAGLLSKEDVESSLLAELKSKLRPGAESDRVRQFESELKSMYASLPKSPNGGLEHSVVRYALHRLLVERHGWFIKGLEPDSDAKSVSSAERLKEWVPSYLQAVLEKRTGGRGFDLSELAAFAATLEDLVHEEAINRLKYVYEVMGLSTNTTVDGRNARDLISLYLMAYLNGGEFKASSREEATLRLGMFKKKYSGWKAVDKWFRELQSNVTSKSDSSDTELQLDFATSARIVEAMGAQFYKFNDMECADVKKTLLGIEDKKQGRVRLAEFYKMGLHTHWEFTEKIDYLRTLGALDESDPADPAVIVPNYLGSRPQCLESSAFYAVCCRNECEDLMGTLEAEIAEPMASPEKIAEMVATLSSDTVRAPRNLSATLIQRLHQVASANGGRIPLHGRLFAQWMHHAFPRECPYPHVGGTNPETPDEWMQRTGHESTQASEEEMMKSHLNSQGPAKTPGKQDDGSFQELPWADEEELLVELPSSAAAKPRSPQPEQPRSPQPEQPQRRPAPQQEGHRKAPPSGYNAVLNNKNSAAPAPAPFAEFLLKFNRILRTLVLSAAAVGLALVSRLALPKVTNEPAQKKEQVHRGWWATLVLFLFPLVVVLFDHALDYTSSNEFLLCGLCWALAAVIIVQLQAHYGKPSFRSKEKVDDDDNAAYNPNFSNVKLCDNDITRRRTAQAPSWLDV